jgi:hypothetical protein
VKLDKTETACVLSGLRLLQRSLNEGNMRDNLEITNHFTDDDLEIPDAEYIDDLCEQINFDGPPEDFKDKEDFIGIISRMIQDGEEVEGQEEPYVMSNDDAVETLNNLISQARELLK